MHGQPDDEGMRAFSHDTAGRLDAVHAWHFEIHEYNVRLEESDHVHCSGAIVCFAHDLHIFLRFDQ